MKLNGLTTKQAEESRAKFGANTLTQVPPTPLWKKLLEGFRDPMIIILCVALAVQVILFCFGKAEWYEPAGILVAILIANGVSAFSENKQEGKAGALKAEEQAREMTKAIRDGKLCELHVSEVVTGDIIYLQAGDKIPADGEIAEGELKVDQAALNGETEEAEKYPNDAGEQYDIKDLLNKYYAYRGTVVCGGEGYMEVKVVGDRTLFGELALEVQEDTRKTPLQVKLGKLAKQISTFGYIGAAAIVLGILIKTFVTGETPADVSGWLRLIIDAVTVAVTVIVCAVPEGLPMLTNILLSFQSLRMAKDNVLVRKINGLETAGSLSLLFSDKTGTITEGRLSVVEIATGNVYRYTELSAMPAQLKMDFIAGVGMNNSASASDGNVIGGNSTDRALMSFLVNSKVADKIAREDVRRFDAFNSTKKTSSAILNRNGRTETFIKGAPERILDRCDSFIDENGNKKPLAEKPYLISYIDGQAGRSMRLLAVAKCEGEDDGERPLTLVSVISIRDNVRKEAADAIREVQNAGIQVVMVTGDRKETAVAIAKEAGLLKEIDDVAMTSAELAEKSDEELKAIIPHLRVVARALPTDKSRLVRLAQELDMVVGMTGDGVNDSPALKKADVGFAMGSGTEVAKEAGDITILDDNFSSIEKAILYGRTMFKSIRKFLVFQLTVNVAAVLICFLAPFFGENTVLTVIQLLLVNLAMDTLAAIAFGSEPALKEYMKDKPVPRKESIVTKHMFIQVVISGIFITALCLGIRFIAPFASLIGADAAGQDLSALGDDSLLRTYLNAAVFACFMMAISLNGFNARTDHMNPFEHIGRNVNFLLVMFGLIALTVVFVTFGGEVLSVTALSVRTWLILAALAFMVIPINMVRKVIVKREKE